MSPTRSRLAALAALAITAACGDAGSSGPIDAAGGADGASIDAAAAVDGGADAAVGCPDPDPPVGSKLACHMVQFLIDGGLPAAAIVDDAVALRPPDGEAMLPDRGWAQQPDADGQRIYELGTPALHLDGQRALFAADGGITLASFASENGGFVELIRLDPDGAVVQNSLEQIPL